MSYRETSRQSHACLKEAERGFLERVEFAQRRATQLKVPFRVELFHYGRLIKAQDLQPIQGNS